MSSYYENSGPGGVGKAYGPLKAGGTTGSIRANDLEVEEVFQLVATEDARSNAVSVKVPQYARITKVYAVVSEAYAATSTVDVQLDGTTVLAAVVDLATVGNTDESLTATDADLVPTTAGGEDLKVVVNAAGLASDTGKAKIVVQYVRA